MSSLKETLQGGLDAVGKLGGQMKSKLKSDLNADPALKKEARPPQPNPGNKDAADIGRVAKETANFISNRTGRAVKNFINKD